MYGPPPQGLVFGGGGRKLVSVKLPTAVEPSKNCTVPLAFGAPAGGQASMLTNSATSPVSAWALVFSGLEGVMFAGGRRNSVTVKPPTAVEPSKNCTVPLAFGAPAGGQASMLTNSATLPVTALALALSVLVVVMSIGRGGTMTG